MRGPVPSRKAGLEKYCSVLFTFSHMSIIFTGKTDFKSTPRRTLKRDRLQKSNLHPERHKGGRRTPQVSACWNVCWRKGQGQLYVCTQTPTMLPVKGSPPVRSQSLRSPEPLSSGRPSWITLSPDERESCHCFFCQSLKSKQYHSKTLGLKICYK